MCTRWRLPAVQARAAAFVRLVRGESSYRSVLLVDNAWRLIALVLLLVAASGRARGVGLAQLQAGTL
ncbi:hypothetical protein [Pseudomonas sp. KCJK8993]|uniref:hypothetical protein n=1 Tax=Pseudomonas sp. KCJK8993 TaxID=3344565 RepID=UPI0039065649